MNKKLILLVLFETLLLCIWLIRHDDTKKSTEVQPPKIDYAQVTVSETTRYDYTEKLWNGDRFFGMRRTLKAEVFGNTLWSITMLRGEANWGVEVGAPFTSFEYTNRAENKWFLYEYCEGYYLKTRDKGIYGIDSDDIAKPAYTNIEAQYESLLEFMKNNFPHVDWKRLMRKNDLIE